MIPEYRGYSLILAASFGMNSFGFRVGGEFLSPPVLQRWQEVECLKQEVRYLFGPGWFLGHFKSHNIQKGEFDAKKRGEYFKRTCFVFHSTFIPHAHTLESTFPMWNKSAHVKL